MHSSRMRTARSLTGISSYPMHAPPPPEKTMHAPQEQPRMPPPPQSNHAPPTRSNHARPPLRVDRQTPVKT